MKPETEKFYKEFKERTKSVDMSKINEIQLYDEWLLHRRVDLTYQYSHNTLRQPAKYWILFDGNMAVFH